MYDVVLIIILETIFCINIIISCIIVIIMSSSRSSSSSSSNITLYVVNRGTWLVVIGRSPLQ